ncbi:HTH-type transcriptional regulator MalT [compost metagenome]
MGEDQQQVAFLCSVTLARQAMSTGETVQAQQILMGAIEQARRQGNLVTEVLINNQRICLMILCGESDLARRLLQENLALLHADDSQHVTLLGRLYVLQGKLHLQRGELDACEKALHQALQHVGTQAMPTLHALTGLSEVCACRGDIQQAFALLQEAERRMQCANVQESCYRAVLNLQSLSLLIHQKNWKQALPMALTIEQYLRGPTARLTGLIVPSLPVHSQLLLALVEQGVGQYQAARSRLQTVQRECLRLNFHGLQTKVQRVLDTLEETIEQPQHVSMAGSFNLLVSEARTITPRQAADHDAKAGADLKPREALSGREVGVLELLAEGLSNREISERLYISTNTVKAHIKHINTKLGVTRRAQAVMRAKATGILV